MRFWDSDRRNFTWFRIVSLGGMAGHALLANSAALFAPNASLIRALRSTLVLLCEADGGYRRLGKHAMKTPPKPPRDRQRPLRVVVSAEERTAIEQRAAVAGLSISAYLRTAGLGHELKSLFEQDAILALVKLHADQGRLGGLLKLWLSTRPGEGAAATEVRAVLKQIEQLQRQLQALVSRL